MGLNKRTYTDGSTVITAQNLNEIQDAIIANENGKEDKVAGKGLSKNDFTDALKAKLEGVEAGAEVNVQADWNEADSSKDDYIKNKPQVYTKSEMDTALGSKADSTTVTALTNRVTAIEDAEGLHKFGVSGIGQKASALTRVWDSVGMTAQVGTDGDNSGVVNSFDNVTPFNRRKCVGTWELIEGRAVFRVEAYLGDEDYAEDGTKGDYVAVECPKAYYYFKNGTLGISAHQWDSDWRPFDIFCHDHDPHQAMDYVYLPAYALAVKNGHAVSLPGLPNEQGHYQGLLTAARTYDGAVGAKATLLPAAVYFYEWAMFTVEFATQDAQSIMYGASALRSANSDAANFLDSTHVLVSYNAARVAGEYVAITTSTTHTTVDYKPTHKILSVTRCDSSGNASPNGSYQNLEVEDLGAGYFNYDTVTTYYIAARPYYTGSCNDVSTPSGSPVSNSAGYYPMKYRHRENVWGNQYHTSGDLFARRIQSGNDYYLKWYYLLDMTAYTPGSTSKPDATDIDTFHELGVQTAVANYADGYIKSKKYDDEFPDIWIPFETSGASASTYFCDYAYLVGSHAARSARFGGNWIFGAFYGPSFVAAYYSPSYASAYYGGDLCFAQ